ncbi:hypothetical protein L3X38_009767 [Prunus dulcis]|uniref:Uncharacterized protein n=1 Tax=Prunus dulcis TaxID=3755 RepID=A0AAD4WGG6_PRUDU|nr:hypothetical protein L3X38_009767 [Prunus dulcis]
MASIRPVNRDDIAERFAPHAPSSGLGSDVIHTNPQAQSRKKKALGLATSSHSPSSAILHQQTRIQEGFSMNPISSVSTGTESCAGHLKPQILEPVEIAPAESSPGTGSTSDNQRFTGKGHRIMENQLCLCRITRKLKKLKQKLARSTQKFLPILAIWRATECSTLSAYGGPEAKEFRIKVDDLSYGGSILITEKVRARLFHVSLELRCVNWLVKELQVLLENKEQRFFRQYKGDSYQVWVEKLNNGKGLHMQLTKCVHGVVKSVVVPQGRNDIGWALMKENLRGYFDKENQLEHSQPIGRS